MDRGPDGDRRAVGAFEGVPETVAGLAAGGVGSQHKPADAIPMRLEPLYRARFSAPQSWSVELSGPHGSEGQDFLLTEGRCEGRVVATWRAPTTRAVAPTGR